LASSSSDAANPEENDMAEPSIKVTIVNHVAIYIAAAPAVVWRSIVEEYVEGRKFREMGNAIEPLNDPAAVLGGYRLRLEQDGTMIDDRICHITERDDVARRLSMYADYLLAPGGMQVYATYHAQSAAGGTRYALDCHARMSLEALSALAEADIAATLTSAKAHFDAALTTYLESVKARLEPTG
jgi:hypothetical protein